jgi:hypothetical protein
MALLAIWLERRLKREAIDGAFDRRHPARGELRTGVLGRIRKVQESPFSLSAGRKSFALKRIDAVLVIWLAPLIDRNVLLGRIISELLAG